MWSCLFNYLPAFKFPEGSSRHRNSTVGNEEEAISVTTIITTLSPDELIADFNQQAQNEAGWVMLDSSRVDDIAWSSWQLADKCGDIWNGLIVITQKPPSSEPFVTTHLAKP